MRVTYLTGQAPASVDLGPVVIGGSSIPVGAEGQIVGYGPNGQPQAVTLPDGTLPVGAEGQRVGYGPGGVPVAVDASDYDDGPITARVAALEGGFADLPPAYDDADLAARVADQQREIEALRQVVQDILDGDGGPVLSAPQFTTLPSLMGSTALGGTVTISLGVASGVPTPEITGTLTRSGTDPVPVTDGHQVAITTDDLGGDLVLVSGATKTQGSDTEAVTLAIPATAVPSIGGEAIGQAGAAGTIYEGMRLIEGDDFDAAPTRWSGRDLAGRYGHSAMHIGFRRTNASDNAMYIDRAFRGARSQSPVDLGYDGVAVENSVLTLTASPPPPELVPLLPQVFVGGDGDAQNRPRLITGGLKTGPSFMFSAQGGFVVEGKMRFQGGIVRGYWPSFWTSTFFWPQQGELDIVEVRKDPATGSISSEMNVHRASEFGQSVRAATPNYPADRWITAAAKRTQGSDAIEFWDDGAVEGVMALRGSITTPVGSIDGAHDIRLDLAVSDSWDGSIFNIEDWPASVEFDWWRAWVPADAAYDNRPTLVLPAIQTTPGGSWAATFPTASELYSAGAGQEQVTAAFDNFDAPGMSTRSGTTKLPASMAVNLTTRTVSGTVPASEGGCTALFLTRSYGDGSPVQRVLLPYHIAPAVQDLPPSWSADAGTAVDITIPYTAFHSGNLGPHTYEVTAPGLTVTGNGTTEARITGTADQNATITVVATNIEGQTTGVTRDFVVVPIGVEFEPIILVGSGAPENRTTVTSNPDGSQRVTTTIGANAGRAHWAGPPAGSVVELMVSIRFDDATRLILRPVSTPGANTGTNILDVTRATVGEVLERTLTYTVPEGRTLLHVIGVTASGQYFTVNPTMRYRVVS